MTNNRVTVNGPETDKLVYDISIASLSTDIPFELPNGRWGIKLSIGAVIFGNSERELSSIAITYDELTGVNELRWCRKLPGKVEITYKSEAEEAVPEQRRHIAEHLKSVSDELEADIRKRFNDLFLKGRKDLEDRGLLFDA